MSTTPAAPIKSHNRKQNPARSRRARLGQFPDQRHVAFYEAERIRLASLEEQKSKRRSELLRKMSDQFPDPPRRPPGLPLADRDDFVGAVIEISRTLKAQGLVAPALPTGVYRWLRAFEQYPQPTQIIVPGSLTLIHDQTQTQLRATVNRGA